MEWTKEEKAQAQLDFYNKMIKLNQEILETLKSIDKRVDDIFFEIPDG